MPTKNGLELSKQLNVRVYCNQGVGKFEWVSNEKTGTAPITALKVGDESRTTSTGYIGTRWLGTDDGVKTHTFSLDASGKWLIVANYRIREQYEGGRIHADLLDDQDNVIEGRMIVSNLGYHSFHNYGGQVSWLIDVPVSKKKKNTYAVRFQANVKNAYWYSDGNGYVPGFALKVSDNSVESDDPTAALPLTQGRTASMLPTFDKGDATEGDGGSLLIVNYRLTQQVSSVTETGSVHVVPTIGDYDPYAGFIKQPPQAKTCKKWRLVSKDTSGTVVINNILRDGILGKDGGSIHGIYKVQNEEETHVLYIYDKSGWTNSPCSYCWNSLGYSKRETYPMCSTDGGVWKETYKHSNLESGRMYARIGAHHLQSGGWILLHNGATYPSNAVGRIHPCPVKGMHTTSEGDMRYLYACDDIDEIVDPDNEEWAPISDETNSWVQVGEKNGVTTCSTYKEWNESNEHPEWGTKTDSIHSRKNVQCCSPDVEGTRVDELMMDGETSFWLGLTKMRRLTKTKQKTPLTVDLDVPVMSNSPGRTGYGGFTEGTAVYDNFKIGSQSNQYTLELGAFDVDSTGGDSLSYHNGRKFSTRDQDNDNWGSNCAVSYKGAWWFKSCHHSNLNGYHNGRGE